MNEVNIFLPYSNSVEQDFNSLSLIYFQTQATIQKSFQDFGWYVQTGQLLISHLSVQYFHAVAVHIIGWII